MHTQTDSRLRAREYFMRKVSHAVLTQNFSFWYGDDAADSATWGIWIFQ